jgi:hypothetical protein
VGQRQRWLAIDYTVSLPWRALGLQMLEFFESHFVGDVLAFSIINTSSQRKQVN